MQHAEVFTGYWAVGLHGRISGEERVLLLGLRILQLWCVESQLLMDGGAFPFL